MSLDTEELAVVLAVAEEQSVSRAADRLMVSQPAVSKQLRRLERRVGVPLFDRLPRGVRPTPAGRLLAGYAVRVFALTREADDRLAELRGLGRGELRVASSTTIAVYLLPPALVAFRAAYPGVRLTVDIVNAAEVAARLAAGDADVALTEGEPDAAAFDARPFVRDELIAIAAPDHPLARPAGKAGKGKPAARRRAGATGVASPIRTSPVAAAPVPAAAVCREPFVVREPGSGTRAVVERALAARGLAVDPVMTVNSTIVIKRAVAGGAGLAFVSRLACEPELRSGALVEVPTTDLRITRPLYRLRVRGRHEGRAVAEFDRLLAEAVARQGTGANAPIAQGSSPPARRPPSPPGRGRG